MRALGETLVVLAEALILLGLGPEAAIICSSAMNAASYALGTWLP